MKHGHACFSLQNPRASFALPRLLVPEGENGFGMLREHRFTLQRRASWEELEALIHRANRYGVRRLDGDNLQRLALLYRAVGADLATAQTRGYAPELLGYLNRLTARGHACVYASATPTGGRRIAHFLTDTFPREVRASAAPILAAAALFIITSVIAYAMVIERPSNVYALLPENAIPIVTKSLHDSNFAFDRDFAPFVSATIITNNIQVAALAFAGGMTVGLLTVWAIVNNGLMLGGLWALFSVKGFGVDFLATVAPHGVIELTAIQIAAGAGLLMASAVIAPGRLRRIDALKLRARRAGVLILGVASMLVVAGIIEGFISPQRTTGAFRLGVGALTFASLFAYLALCGRTPRNEDS
jgi:uncharacterized membrane protein SpoIIM required for sporulation